MFGVEGLCVGWGVRRMQTDRGIRDDAGVGSFEIRHLARLDRLPGTHPPQSSRIQREETATRGALLDGCGGAVRELALYPPVCILGAARELTCWCVRWPFRRVCGSRP